MLGGRGLGEFDVVERELETGCRLDSNDEGLTVAQGKLNHSAGMVANVFCNRHAAVKAILEVSDGGTTDRNLLKLSI